MLDPSERLGAYLRLAHAMDEFYHELALGQGLSDSAFAVLWSILELGEGCTQRDICRQFFLSKQTVHSSVRKLEREGVLSLLPGEGREVRVCLTDRGRDLAREKVLPVMEAERDASASISPEEWRTMMRLGERWLAGFRAAAAERLRKEN